MPMKRIMLLFFYLSVIQLSIFALSKSLKELGVKGAVKTMYVTEYSARGSDETISELKARNNYFNESVMEFNRQGLCILQREIEAEGNGEVNNTCFIFCYDDEGRYVKGYTKQQNDTTWTVIKTYSDSVDVSKAYYKEKLIYYTLYRKNEKRQVVSVETTEVGYNTGGDLNFEYIYDELGRLRTEKVWVDSPYDVEYMYRNDGTLALKATFVFGELNSISFYDESGLESAKEYCQMYIPFDDSVSIEYRFDTHGNWIWKHQKSKLYNRLTTREFTYY